MYKVENTDYGVKVLMAGFIEKAEAEEWFKERMNHLEEFRTGKGTYLFPKNYMQEKPQGYWVNGFHMGLGENRRKKPALELESTFWMVKIKKYQYEYFILRNVT